MIFKKSIPPPRKMTKLLLLRKKCLGLNTEWPKIILMIIKEETIEW